MKIERDSVKFEQTDMHFVEKFGVMEATNMVLDHVSRKFTPFIYDRYQLASVLGVTADELSRALGDIPSMYKRSRIPKKTGGTREIREPLSPLRGMQENILRQILYSIPISEFAGAYYPGARLYRNASPHTGKRCILKMDVTDFFGSIRYDAVLSSVFNIERYPEDIGAALASLCCLDGALPQGACTSPAISNIVMEAFDDSFGRWCGKLGFSYTRYSDDITVSGSGRLYPAYLKAKAMLGDMGLELNEKKTRFITSASRQTVTGLTVNRRVRVPSDYKRKLRQELHYVLRYGLDNAADYMGVPTKKYYQQLMGRLNYVLSIEPTNEYFLGAFEKLREHNG